MAERREQAGGRLTLRDIRVQYGAVAAVDGVDASFAPGTIAGLIGPNGAGKTTLLNAISGLTAMTAGAILLDETDLTELSPRARVEEGVVRGFQTVRLLERETLFDNVLVGCQRLPQPNLLSQLFNLPYQQRCRSRDAAAVVETLRRLGLLGDARRIVAELPYATRRLTEIARLLLVRPKVMLLDEPAAGLDDTSRAELGEVIRWLADSCGLGVLLIEHDVALVLSTCDRVAALEFGELIATDTAQNIASHDGVIKSYLGTSSESGEHVKTPNPAQDAAPGAPVTMSIESPQ